MMFLRALALLGCSAAVSATWAAVGPVVSAGAVGGNGTVDFFMLNDDGSKAKDVMQIPVGKGETLAPNSFTCGRCFCLLLTQDLSNKASYLRNVTFCGTPGPPGIPAQGLQSTVKINSVTTNLHSNYGEGDGGNGYSIQIGDGGKYQVVTFAGSSTNTIVDISKHVAAVNGGQINPGASAFCPKLAAGVDLMWVGVSSADGKEDTILTIDVAGGRVASTTSLKAPLGAGLFANCLTHRPGSVVLQSAGGGQKTLSLVEYDETGGAEAVDSVKLPAGSSYDVTPIVDTIVSGKFKAEFGAILLSPGLKLPGAIFTSKAESGAKNTGSLGDLKELVMSIAVAY